MPTLPPSAATAWLPDTLRGEFEQLNADHMPHRADIKHVQYARSNGASVPSWPVTYADQPCRVRQLIPAQQRIGDQPTDVTRYEVIFMMGTEAQVIEQGDRLDVVGRMSADQSFTLALEVVAAPAISASGTLVRTQCSVLRTPGNQ